MTTRLGIGYWARPEHYWKFKGYGRILLLAGIAVYGIGLILLRVHKERQGAEG